VVYYRAAGEIPRKRHSRFPRPDGGLYAEELMGEDGFSSSSSLLYHRHSPTAIVAAEPVDEADPSLCDHRPLLPRHYRTHELSAGGDAVTGRRLLLANDDVRLLYAAVDRPNELYRNATGDELLYIEDGGAVLESVFGTLTVAAGDYMVIPRATTYRLVICRPRASSSSTPRTPNATSMAPRVPSWSKKRTRACSSAIAAG